MADTMNRFRRIGQLQLDFDRAFILALVGKKGQHPGLREINRFPGQLPLKRFRAMLLDVKTDHDMGAEIDPEIFAQVFGTDGFFRDQLNDMGFIPRLDLGEKGDGVAIPVPADQWALFAGINILRGVIAWKNEEKRWGDRFLEHTFVEPALAA